MSGKRLKLDWSQILPEKEDDAPPLELEVVPSPPIPSSTSMFDSSPLAPEHQLTDGQLEEKMLRLAKLLETDVANSLPDKGQKLQAFFQACKKELDRRKRSRTHKTAEKCEAANESKATEPTDSMPISKISNANSFQNHEGTNLCDTSSQATIVYLRGATTPTCKVSSMEARRSSNANCSSIKTSSFYAPSSGKRCSKRLKLFEGRNALILRKRKYVVLLDEEDIQPKDPITDASADWKKAKIYYPSRDHPEAVELSYLDLKCVEPEQYISSPIMNFYIRYLQKPFSSINKAIGGYYFFNTYLFGKLEAALSAKGDRTLQFSKLRRWWKGINLFEKAYIFLPIHKDLHWSLIIISIPAKEEELRPIILHLDSLGLHKSLLILEVVQCFLTEEWKCVNQNVSSPHFHTREKISDVPLKIDKKEIKVPQQKNEYDCGIFVLYFMERFIREAPERLDRKELDLDMFGSKWFQPEDASGLRKRIRDLLLEEFESSKQDCGTEEGQGQSPSSSSEAVENLTI